MDYPVTMIQEILLGDGWHTVASGLALDLEPHITDDVTGNKATPPNGPWVQFIDNTGKLIACPLIQVQATRGNPPAPPGP